MDDMDERVTELEVDVEEKLARLRDKVDEGIGPLTVEIELLKGCVAQLQKRCESLEAELRTESEMRRRLYGIIESLVESVSVLLNDNCGHEWVKVGGPNAVGGGKFSQRVRCDKCGKNSVSEK